MELIKTVNKINMKIRLKKIVIMKIMRLIIILKN